MYVYDIFIYEPRSERQTAAGLEGLGIGHNICTQCSGMLLGRTDILPQRLPHNVGLMHRVQPQVVQIPLPRSALANVGFEA